MFDIFPRISCWIISRSILCLSGLYYGVSICLVSFASGLSVVTLNLHHRGLRGTEVPYILRRIILGGLARLVFLRFDVERRTPPSTPAAAEPAACSESIPANRLNSRSTESIPRVGTSTTDLRCTCGKPSDRNVHQRGGRQPSVCVSATRNSGWYAFSSPSNTKNFDLRHFLTWLISF